MSKTSRKGQKKSLKKLLKMLKKSLIKSKFSGRRLRRHRFGSDMATMAPVFTEYGPGYDATNVQSYPNKNVPDYKVPWTNASNWYYPVAQGEVQAPDMLIM